MGSTREKMSDDEEVLERPPPRSLEDAEDGECATPAKKRIKSDICGATLEDGRPCPSQAAYSTGGKATLPMPQARRRI